MTFYFPLYSCVVLFVLFGHVLCAGSGSGAFSSSEHWMMVDSCAEQAAHSLADVAHTHRFELGVHPSVPGWYSKGMQIFASKTTDYHWEKDCLLWELIDAPTVMKEKEFREHWEEVTAEWAGVSKFAFIERKYPREKTDLRISFKKREPGDESEIIYPDEDELDKNGVDIIFDDSDIWTNPKNDRWRNFRFAALYEIGHALGLGDSEKPTAVMFGYANAVVKEPGDVSLRRDDILGIILKYKTTQVGLTAQNVLDAKKDVETLASTLEEKLLESISSKKLDSKPSEKKVPKPSKKVDKGKGKGPM